MRPEFQLDGAIREFLWLAVCWNDHNFAEGVVANKCRNVCKELGIESVDDANALLDRVTITVHDEQETDQ